MRIIWNEILARMVSVPQDVLNANVLCVKLYSYFHLPCSQVAPTMNGMRTRPQLRRVRPSVAWFAILPVRLDRPDAIVLLATREARPADGVSVRTIVPCCADIVARMRITSVATSAKTFARIRPPVATAIVVIGASASRDSSVLKEFVNRRPDASSVLF